MYLLSILAQEAPQEIGNAFAIGRNIVIIIQLLAFAGLGAALGKEWLPAIWNQKQRMVAKMETPGIFGWFGLVEAITLVIAAGIWIITHNTGIHIPSAP